MKSQNWLQRTLTYAPVAVVSQSLVAFLIILFVSKSHHPNWGNAVVISVAYGLVMTIVIKSYAERYIKSLGLSHPQQARELAVAVKRMEVPKDPALKKALPAFLERRLNVIERQRKLLPFTLALFGLFLLGSIVSRSLYDIAVFGFFTSLSVYSHFSLKKTEDKIFALQSKAGIRTNETRGEDNEWIADGAQSSLPAKSAQNARTSILVLGTVLLLVFIVAASHPTAPKATNNTDSQSTTKAKSGAAAKLPAEYASSKYDFKITLPSKPTLYSDWSEPGCAANPIPYTMFTSTFDNGAQVLTIYANSWSKQDADFADMPEAAHKSALIDLANRVLENNDAVLTGNIEDKLMPPGNTLAEEAPFTVQEKGYTTNGYIRVFTMDNFEYDLTYQGPDKAAFEKYADSFQYTEPDSPVTGGSTKTAATNCFSQGQGLSSESSNQAPDSSASTTPTDTTDPAGNDLINSSSLNSTITINGD